MQEIKLALRGLRRSPVFAGTALATLALASGAVTTVFAVIHAVLIRPLPVVDQDRIVMAWKEDYQAGFAHYPFSYPAVEALKDQLSTVSDVATIDYNGAWPLSTVDGDRGLKLPTGMVSGHLFQLLGVRPVAGRLFLPADDILGGPHVIVIGEGLWRTRYAGDARAIGKTLRVFGVEHEIIGVVPADLAYPRGAVAWTPMFPWQGKFLTNPDAVTQDLVARLRPGRTLGQFRAELEAARTRTALEQRLEFKSHRVVARTFADEVVGDLRPTLLLLGSGALLVLVVACANIGSLLLVRTGGKLHEVAIRAATGAGRGQLFRAVFLEHLLLVIGGVSLGLALAWVSVQAAGSLLPLDLPRSRVLSLGLIPLVAGATLGIAVGIAAGLAPALALVRADLGAALRSGGRSNIRGWGTHPVRRLLVASQLGLAVTAVAGAGLLLRTLERLRSIEVGFEPAGLLFVEITTSATLDTSVVSARATVDRVIERIGLIPGVGAVAATFSPPFVGNAGAYSKMRAEGQADAGVADIPLANRESVTPGYFATMRLSLRRGRFLLASDREGANDVVVINEALGRYLWPGQDPLGKRLGYAGPTPRWRTVVGIVGDTRYNDLKVPVPTTYVPYRQIPEVPWGFVVRLGPGVGVVRVVPAIGRAIRQADPALALTSATPMAELLGKPLATTTVTTVLATLFGLVALGLAAVGVFGVLSSYVVQRTREIGVRMALGAGAGAVRLLVVRQGLTLVAGGVAAGLGASVLVGRGLTGFLYRVAPADPLTLVSVATVLVAVGVIAMLVPAQRATQVDPVVALRAE